MPVISVRFDDIDVIGSIDERAKALGLTRSEWIRRASEYALTVKGASYKITVTREVSI